MRCVLIGCFQIKVTLYSYSVVMHCVHAVFVTGGCKPGLHNMDMIETAPSEPSLDLDSLKLLEVSSTHSYVHVIIF